MSPIAGAAAVHCAVRRKRRRAPIFTSSGACSPPLEPVRRDDDGGYGGRSGECAEARGLHAGMRSSHFHIPLNLLARRSQRGCGFDASCDMPEPEPGETLPKVRRAWERGGGEGGKERHRRGSARSRHAPVALLPSSGPRPSSPHAPRRVSERPAPAGVPRSQPVGRPLAARAQIEVRARRGARARDEKRGTRHEARGTGRDEECRRLPQGGGPSKSGVAGCVARALVGWALVTGRSDLECLRRAESSGIAPAMLKCVEMRNQAAWS